MYLSNKDYEGRLIFDGYPRNLVQVKNLDNLLKKYSQKIDIVLKLSVSLETIKKRISERASKNTNNKSSLLGIAFKMSTELVAAVLVGTIIGFIFDNWFGTKPWLILTFFFVGVIAGVLNVIRSAKNMQK